MLALSAGLAVTAALGPLVTGVDYASRYAVIGWSALVPVSVAAMAAMMYTKRGSVSIRVGHHRAERDGGREPVGP